MLRLHPSAHAPNIGLDRAPHQVGVRKHVQDEGDQLPSAVRVIGGDNVRPASHVRDRAPNLDRRLNLAPRRGRKPVVQDRLHLGDEIERKTRVERGRRVGHAGLDARHRHAVAPRHTEAAEERENERERATPTDADARAPTRGDRSGGGGRAATRRLRPTNVVSAVIAGNWTRVLDEGRRRDVQRSRGRNRRPVTFLRGRLGPGSR